MIPRPPLAPHVTESGDLTQAYADALEATFPEVRSLGGVPGCRPHPDREEELRRCFVFQRLDALEEYINALEPYWNRK